MRSSASFLALSGVLLPALAAGAGLNAAIDANAFMPSQTYFVPMPEDQCLESLFKVLDYEGVTKNSQNPPVITLVAMTVSVDNTIIFYGK
jgi:hypothetical protein